MQDNHPASIGNQYFSMLSLSAVHSQTYQMWLRRLICDDRDGIHRYWHYRQLKYWLLDPLRSMPCHKRIFFKSLSYIFINYISIRPRPVYFLAFLRSNSLRHLVVRLRRNYFSIGWHIVRAIDVDVCGSHNSSRRTIDWMKEWSRQSKNSLGRQE